MLTTHRFRSDTLGGTVECEGPQPVTLLREIATVHPGLVWCIAHVDAGGPHRYDSPAPRRIGDAIVELRAFDMSYWELATTDDAIRHSLA